MTRRRWIADEFDTTTASLTGAQAAHLIRVLRVKTGMQYDVVAGEHVHRATVEEVGAERVHFTLHERVEANSSLPLTLVLAVFKFDRLEWAIEKATELGVASIAPVIARRTEKHLAQSAEKRVERWRRIVHEAAQQSRRSDVPLMHEPVSLAQRIKAAAQGTRIVLAEQERTTTLRNVVEEAVANAQSETPELEIAIGPEGGWAPDEEALFDANGWRAVSLGPRILRAETAAIVALAVAASFLE